MLRSSGWPSALLAAACLSGCGTPFSGRTAAVDWSPGDRAGTITVSHPKMYRREALINERSEEVAWLKELLGASRTIEFKPEIAREMEQITALAAAAGVSVDPASELNYRRAQERGDLQQQIDVMKLELQLDQLRRDAELVREKFAAQTEPVNPDLGETAAGPAAAATSPAAAAAADQLKAAIDRLLPALTGRLDAEGKLARLSDTTANPADTFRDRSAYRDLLKSARNAASLDELHDLNGAALIRLTFQATVLPERPGSRVPGVVQMKVTPPVLSERDESGLYAGWLAYVNEALNGATVDGGWVPNTELVQSAVAEQFDLLEYRYPKSGAPAAACRGLVLDAAAAQDPACGALVFAAPKFHGVTVNEGASSTLQKYLSFFNLGSDDASDARRDQQTRELITTHARALAPNCGPPAAPPVPAGAAPAPVQTLERGLERARVRLASGDALAGISRLAHRTLAGGGVAPPADEAAAWIAVRTARARLLVASFEQAAYAGCGREAVERYRESGPRFYVPPGFQALLRGDEGRISVYEVGPREQVQQVSTVARAANSLGLALSLAAARPGSGAAMNAASSYSRQAMGRAQAQERVPAVVGYTSAPAGAFGWVLGPRATVDPRGRLDLEQVLKPYDLSVDLSVPGWWPWFTLQTVTRWAPGGSAIAGGTVGGQAAAQVRVSMSPNSADYEDLTARLAAGGAARPRQAQLLQVRGVVSACKPAVLMLKGRNLWRTTAVLVGERKLDGAAISVLPDMSGVLVDVPALDASLVEPAGTKVPVRVLTPYGDDSRAVDFVPKTGTSCKEEAKTAAAPGGASVGLVEPVQIQVPAAITFQVRGVKLDVVDRVTLNGQVGKVTPGKEGKSLQAAFSAEQTAGLPVSRSVRLGFFKGEESVGEKLIEVVVNAGPK